MNQHEKEFQEWWRDFDIPHEWVVAWATSDKTVDSLTDFITDFGGVIYAAGKKNVDDK